MKLAWLVDNPRYMGGAELSALTFGSAAPDSIRLLPVRPGERPSVDVDGFIVHNCVSYGPEWIDVFGDKPIIKLVYDIWHEGDPALRAWFLTHAAALVLVSPKLQDWTPWNFGAQVHYIPSPVDIPRFQAGHETRSERAIWVGRLHYTKGVQQAIHWATQQGLEIDVFGYGDIDLAGEHYRGEVDNKDLPTLLSRYSHFVFLPNAVDPCPRTVIEAWAAGCQLVVNDKIGVVHWIENQPDKLYSATSDFWTLVEQVINGSS